MGTFNEYLTRELEDPEFAAYFAEAQIESGYKLLRAGLITTLTTTSLENKTKRINWRIIKEGRYETCV